MHCVNFLNALINTLLTHPGPSRGIVGGGVIYPGTSDVWGALPVEYTGWSSWSDANLHFGW